MADRDKLFNAKVKRGRGRNACWLWTGSTVKGYGVFWDGKRNVKAHRWAWTRERGMIPDGMKVLHECDTPGCVRSSHLWLGTQKDNIHDAMRKGRAKMGRPRQNRTHCPAGHPYDEANTHVDKQGRKTCRRCNAEVKRAWRERGRKPKPKMKTCKHGHSWKQFRKTDSNGYRICAECRRLVNQRYNRKRTAPS